MTNWVEWREAQLMTEPQPLFGAEALDEEELGADPFEAGMDPPEHWSQADRFGNTEGELRQGASLEERLSEEEPDTTPEE